MAPPSNIGDLNGIASATSSLPTAGANDTNVDASLVNPDGRPPAALAAIASSQASSTTPTVSAACLACRNKHLKCDGKSPCSRCIAAESEAECVYVASRRGYKGPRRGTAPNPNKRRASASPPPPPPSSSSTTATSDSCPMLLGSKPSPQSSGLPSSASSNFNSAPSMSESSVTSSPYSGTDLVHSSTYPQSQTAALPQSPTERCLDSFYRNFHAAHPFVLPKPWFLQATAGQQVKPLVSAMHWIGSLYIADLASLRDSYFEHAYQAVYDMAAPPLRDGYLVQAMMLLIIGLDGSCQQAKAREILADVEKLAIDIALNTRPYAAVHGNGNPVLEESWRRTWWELFVMDGMVAGVHRQTNFLLFDIPTDVALPCEETQYLSGNIPSPAYLQDMEDCDFSGDDREFSSFAYRILAAHNLGKFMRVPPILTPEDENLGRIEALLTNWRLHLPQSKLDALQKDGQLDEMIFQAHMMTHATSIMLHQPHSQLDSSPVRAVNSCAPHRPVASGDAYNAHTRHTLSSANDISKLVTYRVPLLSHSHFFTCVVTLSSIVHLSKWALYFVQHDDDDLRQQIRLNMGALAKMAEVWRAANTACGQVRGVAQEIYQAKKAAQQANITPWVGLSREEMLMSIMADENIMREIERLNNPLIPALLSP